MLYIFYGVIIDLHLTWFSESQAWCHEPDKTMVRSEAKTASITGARSGVTSGRNNTDQCQKKMHIL